VKKCRNQASTISMDKIRVSTDNHNIKYNA